jgi:hypothetical protein
MCIAHACNKRQRVVDRLLVRLGLKQRRTEMKVHADDFQMWQLHRMHNGTLSSTSLDREAKLAVQHARGCQQMRVRINAGRQAQQNALSNLTHACQFIESTELRL